MIGDMLGNIGNYQEKLKQKLEELEVVEQSSGGEISVSMSAAKTIKDINIDLSKVDLSESDQLEDLLLITINKAQEKADDIAAKETQNILNDLLPPGMGNLFG
jgi:hypothetical protein